MRTRRDDAFSAELGARLRHLLIERGWSQTDLAHASGIAVSQINRWIRGRSTPTPEKVVALCHHLDVSADWLLGLTTERHHVASTGDAATPVRARSGR